MLLRLPTKLMIIFIEITMILKNLFCGRFSRENSSFLLISVLRRINQPLFLVFLPYLPFFTPHFFPYTCFQFQDFIVSSWKMHLPMKIRKFPVLYMLLPYLAGVLLSYFVIPSHVNALTIILFCLILLLISLLFRFLFPHQAQLPSMCALCFAFFLLGTLLTNAHYHPYHFLKSKKMV